MASSTVKNSVVIAAIAVVAVLSSFASLQYYNSTSASIARLSDDQIKSNSNIEAFEIAHILETKVTIVSANIQSLVNDPDIKAQDVNQSEVLFSNVQKSTKDFTTTYFWVDKAGKLIWSDAFYGNESLAKQYNGGDRSTRDYFIQPRDTHQPYYSTLIESVDGVPRLYVSYPILDDKGSFQGIIAAAIDLKLLGKYLEAQLPSGFQSSVGMLDRNGILLYTQNSTLIGKNVFGSEVQSLIPDSIKDSFNSFIRQSLTGSAGSGDIQYRGNTTTIAYQPISIQQNFFAVLYITVPHLFASDVASLIEEQRNFSLIVTAIIGAAAIAIGSVVITWNRRLGRVVEKRTAELKTANESLVQSNKQLEAANRRLDSANKQLLVHDKMQKEFINVAAHELRTPTQAIIGYTDLLQAEPEEDVREHIKAIGRNALRLERLTSDILDVTRIEGNLLRLEKERVNLDYIIASVIRDTKNRLSNGSVKFVYEPTNIIIEADQARITQLISNLLTNAVKFTPKGEITITADKKVAGNNNIVVVSVKDTGEGIHPDIFPRLFTKFTTRSQTGTGLGLFICKAIVEAHGGKIWAENNKDGKGATFTFTLPA